MAATFTVAQELANVAGEKVSAVPVVGALRSFENAMEQAA